MPRSFAALEDERGLPDDLAAHFLEDLEPSQRPLTPAVVAEPEEVSSLEQLPYPVELFGDIKPGLSNRFLVKGLLLAGTKIVIFGQEGSAKSFLLLDVLLHIASGRPWFGRKVERGGVIYIAAEGQAGTRLRVEAWKQHHQVRDDIPFAMIPTAVDLLDPAADLAKLHQTLNFLARLWGMPLAAIAIDTLSQTIGGGDENGPDMAAYVANCTRLTAPFGCATAIVHHQPLDAPTKRPRGHSSLSGGADTMLHVEGREDPRRITTVKQKDLERGPDLLFSLKSIELGRDEDDEPVRSCVVEQSEFEPVPTKAGRKLSATNQTALAALDRVLVRDGFSPPSEIPDDLLNRLRTAKVAKLVDWQAEALSAFADPDKQADTPGRLFRRARTDLQGAEIVGIWEEFVWRTFP